MRISARLDKPAGAARGSRHLSMIPKSGYRFSEKLMLRQ
jgi:hypothetical protein